MTGDRRGPVALELFSRVVARLAGVALVNLQWLLGVLAGGVVLGVAPATTAAVLVLQDPDPLRSPWQDFWRHWRSAFRRSQPTLGVPLVLLAAGVWSAWRALSGDDDGVARGAAVGALVVALLLWGVVSQIPTVAATLPDAGVRDVWRATLLVAVLAPVLTTGIAVGTVSLVLLQLFVLPAALPFFAVGAPAWLVALVAPRALDSSVATLQARRRVD